MYKLTFEMDGQIYKGEGETVYDAINSLGLDYTQIKVKGTFTVKQGKLSADKFMYMRPLRRIFANKTLRAGFARNLTLLLKEHV